MKTTIWRTIWIENMPEKMNEGDLYISTKHRLIEHMCACGCGSEVSLPLGRSEWRVEYDGDTISVLPSIGNWRLPCKSHYMILESKTKWCKKWSEEEIYIGRLRDRHEKETDIQRKIKRISWWQKIFKKITRQ